MRKKIVFLLLGKSICNYLKARDYHSLLLKESPFWRVEVGYKHHQETQNVPACSHFLNKIK